MYANYPCQAVRPYGNFCVGLDMEIVGKHLSLFNKHLDNAVIVML